MKLAHWGLLALVCMAANLVAAEADFANSWALNGPYSMEGLKGKVVVLRFFESGCPTCRALWPGLDVKRKTFDGQPVLFVGINSGHPVKDVTTYAKGVKTEWSIYADVDRAFETAVLKQVISLQNIHQCMIMSPTGEIRPVAEEFEGEVTKELANAKWKMDPKDIPAALKKAWLSLEFGQASQAIVSIKQALNATDKEVKAAATKLDDVVKVDVTKRWTEAQAKATANEKWEAYKSYDFLATSYKPYPEATKAAAEMSKLTTDPKVKKELQAKVMLEKIQQWAASRVKTDRENAKAGLTMLQDKFADTEAGAASKSITIPDKV